MKLSSRIICYLNLTEPWWKTLRSLTLKGRRFESWEEIVKTSEEATAYWNKRRHPYVWAVAAGVDRASGPESPGRRKRCRLGGCATNGHDDFTTLKGKLAIVPTGPVADLASMMSV